MDYIKEYLRLEKEKEALLENWLKENCPFKVGEQIEIFAYPYKGKTGEITEIKAYWYSTANNFAWKIKGSVLNNNGIPGLKTFEAALWRYKSYLKEQNKC